MVLRVVTVLVWKDSVVKGIAEVLLSDGMEDIPLGMKLDPVTIPGTEVSLDAKSSDEIRTPGVVEPGSKINYVEKRVLMSLKGSRLL